jgi:N-sulfoglucosamine sulfohydrolase
MPCRGDTKMLRMFVALAMALILVQPAAAQLRLRPNIVLIVADDHGTDAIGAYGNPVIKTPNLDGLAQEGIRFTSAFATTASCSPSRSVLLTGLQNHKNGMYGLQHWQHHFQSFDDIKSLPVILAQNGYRTGRIGKYHVAPEVVYHFDEAMSEGAANDMASIARSPLQMADIAAEFVKKSDQPFFLYFATDDPHRAFPFDTWPKPNSFGNRPQGYPGIKEVIYDPKNVRVPWFLPDRPETRLEIAQYYQAVSRIDQGVGHLFDLLKASGKWDNTIVIYLSDNGIAFPGAKTTLYDPGIRLPLIFKAPDVARRGGASDALVSWTDITPTLLDYAGIDAAPLKLHGQSIRKIVEGAGEVAGRDAVFGSHSFHEVQMYYPMRMIRTHRYKLIQNLAWPLAFPQALDLIQSITWKAHEKSGEKMYGLRTTKAYLHRPRYELYDLISDPHEARNRADDPAYAKVRAKLLRRLHTFIKDTGDPWLSKLDYE